MEEFASLVVPASGGMRVLDVGGRVIQGGARSIFEARGCNFTTHCSLCAKHDNSLVLLPYFRQPPVLAAPREARLAALFSLPQAARVLDEHCPMRASIGNRLLTGTVIRRPVDRVISKYYFLRTYCAEKAARLGRTSCAALDYELLDWLYSSQAASTRSVVGAADWQATHEILGYLGDDNHSTSYASLRQAQHVLDAIDVVGITERMDETMVLFSEVWGLPLPAVQQSFVSLLVNPTKRPVNASVRAAIAAHPGVRRETQLYEYALRRFERDMSAVPDRAAKVGAIKAAAFACSINASCVSGEPQPGAGRSGAGGADEDER